jgi:hypothetical protein
MKVKTKISPHINRQAKIADKKAIAKVSIRAMRTTHRQNKTGYMGKNGRKTIIKGSRKRYQKKKLEEERDADYGDEIIDDTNSQILGKVDIVDVSESLPQMQVIQIACTPDPIRLLQLAAQWPLLYLKKGLDNDEVDIGGSFFGRAFALYVGCAYDLFLALRGEVSYLTYAPRAWKELRDSLLPKTVRNYQYYWDMGSIDKAFGPGNFFAMLQTYVAAGTLADLGDFMTSVSWKDTALFTPLDTLVSVLPVITDEVVFNSFGEFMLLTWNAMESAGVYIDMVKATYDTPYVNCQGPFSGTMPQDPFDNPDWSVMYIEQRVPNKWYWTCNLGICVYDSLTVQRSPPVTHAEYAGSHHYGLYLTKEGLLYSENKNGKMNRSDCKTLIRFKYYYLEEILLYVLSVLTFSDIYHTNQNTTALLDQLAGDVAATHFLPSELKMTDQASFLRWVVVTVCQRFSQVGYYGTFTKSCLHQINITGGSNWTPGMESYTSDMPVPLVNFLEGITTVRTQKSSGNSGYVFINVPCLVVAGNTYGNPYVNVGVSTVQNLMAVVNLNMPNVVGDWSFLGPLSPLPNFITAVGPTVSYVSQVAGVDVPMAIQVMSGVFAALKANCEVSDSIPPQSPNTHSYLFYTRLIVDVEPEDDFSTIVNWTFLGLTHRLIFDVNTISHYITVPLPTSCLPAVMLQTIYSENYLMESSKDGIPFVNQSARGAIKYVHDSQSAYSSDQNTRTGWGGAALLGNVGKIIGPFADILGGLMGP